MGSRIHIEWQNPAFEHLLEELEGRVFELGLSPPDGQNINPVQDLGDSDRRDVSFCGVQGQNALISVALRDSRLRKTEG